MNTNNMKKLLRGLVTEEAVPGLDNTVRVTKDSKKHNDDYQKEVASKMKEYEEGITGEEDEDTVKYNSTDKQKEYHDDMETLNGQEMINYDQDPGEKFKDRAEMALKGDSKMGNKVQTGEWNPETGEGNGNTESTWGASDDKFGEKLVDRMKSSNKKRNDATKAITQFGDDIELGQPTEKTNKKLAIKENTNPMADPNYTHFAVQKSSNKILNGWNYSDYEREELQSEKQAYFFEDLDDFISNGMKKNDILITTRKNMEKKGIDPTNSDNWYKVGGAPSAEAELGENAEPIGDESIRHPKYPNLKKYPQFDPGDVVELYDGTTAEIESVSILAPPKGTPQYIYDFIGRDASEAEEDVIKLVKQYGDNTIQENKIGMKRLRFKTPFNGVETALKVIPENYKQDDKVFEMTDGNETYKIRWEGTLTEGEAVVLESENAKLIQEGRDKVMKLMNYNSKDVFGSRKGKDRVEENTNVASFISKYKGLIEESEKKDKK